MKIAIGSDERTEMTDAIVAELRRRGHGVWAAGPLAGPLVDSPPDLSGGAGDVSTPAADAPTPPIRPDHLWPSVARTVAEAVAGGAADEGLLLCWTGTGVSMAANKVPGIRAALCADAATARGARLWNNANVLCLSLRLTTAAVATEILDAWFDTSFIPNDNDNACLALLEAMETNKLGITN
ncbi:putative ribose/galactose isomerase [Candidatus Promineifilum breve]|uniref:Ribose/galactose isomerase n=1 Tax=Candidatus Promineifilum breve TaxID=1806508 RepID=A0A170PK26_9CHLR|nr:RpiB/LacA/LacB family sugar-phosphate isomerase [Candidatus Promineifilum breve]CUS06307.1 putative ribose/galactose isomerase [Candidatus Promineifilum breve]